MEKVLLVLLFSCLVLSHQVHQPAKCDHDTIMSRYLEENPEEALRINTVAAQMREYAERYISASGIKDAAFPVTIPVVFHILYSNARPDLKVTAANISAEINYMNQWYATTNTYYNRTNVAYGGVKAVAADLKISFALATRDPSGNPTTGIIYHESSVVNTCGNTQIFRTVEGGADAWNTLQYMNIWTCPLTNGAAGYAYLPSTATHYRDGIVMAPQYIGYAYASGSLLAHEVGHWLGLPHTFKGIANDCSTDADNIADTPRTDVTAWDYVSSTVCTNPAGFNANNFQRCGNPTNIQNCMDYNWEECKSCFTKGQAAVMRSFLDNVSSVRGGLRTSPALGSQSCTPNCAGKVCGSNGCGGICGDCLSGSVCSANQASCTVAGATQTATATPSRTRSPAAASASSSPSRTRSPVSASASPTRSPVSASSSPTRSPVPPSSSSTPSRTRSPGSSASSSPSRTRSPVSASPSPTRSPVSASPSRTRSPVSASPSSTRSAATPPSSTPTPSRTRSPQGGRPDRDVVIQRMNTYRAQVTPAAASPLTNLSYNVTLESQAQTHANGCVYSAQFGQIVAIYQPGNQTGNLSTLFTSAIDLWAQPKPNYALTSTSATCTHPTGSCGTYTQMIWNHAQYPTTQVGCAAAYCPSNGDATFVVCQFSGWGNYIGLLPYVVGPSFGCSATCAPGQCGIIQTVCGTLNCGECCDDPCVSNECGVHMNSCNNAVTCPSCPSGSTCAQGSSGTVCVDDAVCVHEDECAAAGFECGNKVFCGVNQACGFCDEGEICSDFKCVEDPCNNCGAYSECIDNECKCIAGYVEIDGLCTMPSLGIDYTNMFAQTFPEGSPDFVIPDTELILIETGPHILKWATSENVVDKYTTKTSIVVSITSGEFGLNIRHGQKGADRENDAIRWHVKDIGSSPKLALCLVYFGKNYCGSYTPISFPKTAKVTVTMGFDGKNILTTWQVGSGSIRNSYVLGSYYPDLGAVSYYLSSQSYPSLSNATLATSSTLTVSLVDCIDADEWALLFYRLTGANPATTAVDVREQNEDGNCKGAAGGKIVASGFTVVITSTGVPAAALVSQLTASVGSPAGAALGLSSASVVAGAAGANAAGFATTIGALGGATVAAPAVGGAGAGGGGAAGLSGGAIAGIVIGSVAGAVLIVGVTAVIVAAVIVAAVIVAKKAGSDSEPEPVSDSGPSKRESRASRRIRDTIYDIFRAPRGGVDIMNNPNGHQSITARSPKA